MTPWYHFWDLWSERTRRIVYRGCGLADEHGISIMTDVRHMSIVSATEQDGLRARIDVRAPT